jgi:hypothetical protein
MTDDPESSWLAFRDRPQSILFERNGVLGTRLPKVAGYFTVYVMDRRERNPAATC